MTQSVAHCVSPPERAYFGRCNLHSVKSINRSTIDECRLRKSNTKPNEDVARETLRPMIIVGKTAIRANGKHRASSESGS